VDADHASSTVEENVEEKVEEKDSLLEASEMQPINAKRQVTFRWPNNSDIDHERDRDDSAVPLQRERGGLKQRKSRETTGDSLLGVEDETRGPSEIESTTQRL
jgi:hypothetical protein